MRLSHRPAQLVLGGLIILITTLAPEQRALALASPGTISVHFSDSAATITWDAVPGSQGYAVTIRRVGDEGPDSEEQVLANTYTVALTRFPGYGRFAGGYNYQICSIAVSGDRACTIAGDSFYVQSAGHGVSTSILHRAVNKISSCLEKGEEAGLVVAAGMGIKAAVASWIPGAGEVTAGAVAAAGAGAGASGFAACITGW